MVGNLVEDFAVELENILKRENFLRRTEAGELVIPSVYAHALPPVNRRTPAGKPPSRAPWVLVALYNGEQPSADDDRSATLHITDMVYDDNENMQGGHDALQLLGIICRNLYEQSFVADQYEVRYPLQFAVMDDVKYPYFAAGLAIKVSLQGVAPQNRTGGYAYV